MLRVRWICFLNVYFIVCMIVEEKVLSSFGVLQHKYFGQHFLSCTWLLISPLFSSSQVILFLFYLHRQKPYQDWRCHFFFGYLFEVFHIILLFKLFVICVRLIFMNMLCVVPLAYYFVGRWDRWSYCKSKRL